MVTEQEVDAIGQTLVDPKQPLQARFRALFTLRGLGGPGAIAWISQAFSDDSALLKHELAYCLGQMQDARAIPVLVDVLQDTRQEPMVRHEAGEALGAIGDPEVLELLKQYSSDPVIEVTRPPLVSLPGPRGPPGPTAVCLLPPRRWPRPASWLCAGWSGCSSTAGSRRQDPTSPWTLPRRLRSVTWGACGRRCWTSPGRSSSDTAPCSPCATREARRPPWRWPRACTVGAPSSATRSATSWDSCSMRRRCPSWQLPWPGAPRTPWCGTSARRPWAPSPGPPAWPRCRLTRTTQSAWCVRAARWLWTCMSTRPGEPSSTRTAWSSYTGPPPRAPPSPGAP
ncbi:deoxyhypusine hydroxylase isoform X1 [Macaca mulatta]